MEASLRSIEQEAKAAFRVHLAFVAGPRRGVQWRDVGPDHLAERVGITALATERLQQHGNARLMLHNQLQHDLVEGRPMSRVLTGTGIQGMYETTSLYTAPFFYDRAAHLDSYC